jgi:predicted MFS family arabinose efflux permease
MVYEPKRVDPLIEIRFFRSIPFSGATLIAVCTFGAFSGFLFLNTLYLQDVRGLSALQAGLCMLPIAVVIVALGPLSGRVVATRGPRGALIVAGTCMALGALGLTRLTSDMSYWWLFGSYIVFAIGFAVVNVPITNTAVSGMPRSQAGVAAAIASTSRQVGASLGVAVVGSVVSAAVSAPTAASFAPATHVAWWILVGLGLAVLALGIATNGQRARTSAARVAELFDDDALTERPPVGSRS